MIITGFPVSVVSIILDRYSEKKQIEKEKKQCYDTITSLRYLLCLSIVLGIKDVTRYVRGYTSCNCSQQTTNRSAMGYSSLPVRERL